VANAVGSGSLAAANSSWSCRTTTPWSLTCQGQSGQVLLEQSGLGRIVPLVVRVTDASGTTHTTVVVPS
jgi:hypothetical protein